MASGRMLRSQISTSSQVNDLSLKAALLFTWLVSHVDDFGRMSGNPRRIKALVVPMRDDITSKDTEKCLYEIASKNLIKLYEVDGEIFLQLVNFEKHQTGLHKRTSSKYPAPEAASNLDSGKFPEIPGNSGSTELNLTKLNLTERVKEFTNVNSMSGKPDVDTLFPSNLEIKKQAIEVIEFLNEKTGRKYRASDTNLKFIMGRLKSGATVSNCRMIIAKKYREWKDDPKMIEYARPATLFNATKFEQYLGELG